MENHIWNLLVKLAICPNCIFPILKQGVQKEPMAHIARKHVNVSMEAFVILWQEPVTVLLALLEPTVVKVSQCSLR